LIVATVVAFLILLVVGFYLLVHYQHPDDHNDAYLPKIVVLLGFVLAGATVLMFPLDVANNEGYAGELLSGANASALLSPGLSGRGLCPARTQRNLTLRCVSSHT